MLKLAAPLLGLAMLGACATSTGSTSTSVAAADEAAATNVKYSRTMSVTGDPNEVFCKTDNMTGSRVKKHRVCLTRAEWNDLSAQNDKEMMDRTNNFPTGNE